jgi:hypothetical protein
MQILPPLLQLSPSLALIILNISFTLLLILRPHFSSLLLRRDFVLEGYVVVLRPSLNGLAFAVSAF